MARYILDLNEEWGMTVIMIEHDIGVVMDISHRLIVLDFGRMIAEGQPHEVIDHPQVKKAYLGEDEEPAPLLAWAAAGQVAPHGGERAACARLPEYRDSDTS